MEDWKKVFLDQIERNSCKAKALPITAVFDEYIKVSNENKALQEKLKNRLPASDAVVDLQAEVQKYKNELTEYYKSKAERTQELLDKTTELNNIKSKNSKLSKKEAKLEEENKNLNQQLKENDITIQVLQDEVRVLQLELVSTGDRYEKLKADNALYLSELLKNKEQSTTLMNNYNRLSESHRKLEQQLELQSKSRLSGAKLRSPSSSTEITETFKAYSGVPTNIERKFQAHDQGGVNAVSFSNNGGRFVTGGMDKFVVLWDSNSALSMSEMKTNSRKFKCTQGVMAVEFCPKDEFVLGGSNDSSTSIWSTVSNRLRLTLTGHTEKVLAARFCGDSSKVVTGSYDRTIKVWDLNKGFCNRTMFAFSSTNDLVLGDDKGSSIISGHLDKNIRFWDTKTGECTKELNVHSGQVTSLDLSNDRNVLLTNSKDNTLKLIDVRMYRVISTFCGSGYKNGMIWSRACFSPTGKYVVVGGADGVVFVWDTSSEKLHTLKGHNSAVACCAWSPVTSQLVSCDREGNVLLWNHS